MVINIVGISGIVIVALYVAYSSITTVQEDKTKLLLVNGEYKNELDTGINFIPPFISSIREVETKTIEISVPRTTEISGDNKRVSLESSVYSSVSEPAKFLSSVNEYEESVWKMAKSEISSIIIESKAEGFRRNQRKVESDVKDSIQKSVSEWGIKVERVDITSISVEERD